MRYQLSEIAHILGTSLQGNDRVIRDVVTDSRRIMRPEQSIFIAIQGQRFDGHSFLEMAYNGGIRSFLVQEEVILPEDCSILHVKDSLAALHDWAAHHRSRFTYPVIGITGSYGKTAVKERLAVVLGSYYSIIRSPRSYNSQVGVPLSVLGMEEEHDLAIFEAGISEPGEMEKLERIIRPDIGIFTGLGEAHQENFKDRAEHLKEKCKLFVHSQILISQSDENESFLQNFVKANDVQSYTWGYTGQEDLHILEEANQGNSIALTYCVGGRSFKINMPQAKEDYFVNQLHCLAVCYALGESQEQIEAAFQKQQATVQLPELNRSRTGSLLLSQTGLLDAAHLSVALEQLYSTGKEKKKILLLIETEAPLANSHRVDALARVLSSVNGSAPWILCIGKGMKALADKMDKKAIFLADSAEFHAFLAKNELNGDFLISGTWSPFYVQVHSLLQGQGHHTRITIDMEAVVHNLNVFRASVGPDVKIMGMVKASAYGSGDTELARLLEFHRIDYLGVAYADEGIHLRRQGVLTPILVMNSSLHELESMRVHDLEPVIYSIEMLREVTRLEKQSLDMNMRIHLEFDTGMHRLGILSEEAEEAIRLIEKHPRIELLSVFSHLLASDDPSKEVWTRGQLEKFDQIKKTIETILPKRPLFHILNTAGISRYPEYRMDMVRLGIGLYGHDSNRSVAQRLRPILRWDTELRQVKTVKKGDTIGYGGRFVLEREARIGILPVGYADGIHRSLGNGKGSVFIQGKKCPFVGSICMDMSMVDLGDMTMVPGEPVEIIGEHQRIEELAEQLNTIAYEVLTSIPGRVKRTYING